MPIYAPDSNLSGYALLKKKANDIASDHRTNGWAYIISGVVAVGASIPAYYLSDDVFAKGVYSLAQTLGVVAVGYGSYLVLVDNDYTRFVKVVDEQRDLTPRQRDNLANSFLRENAQQARASRKIRVITYSLTAALNYVNAATATDTNLRTALFFIAGVNTLAALGSGFSETEEEKLAETSGAYRQHSKLDFFVGPIVGLRLSF